MNVSAKRIGNKGFTLVEFMVVVAVIITIAGIVMKYGAGAIDKKNTAAALRQIEHISAGLQKYKADLGGYPTDLKNLWDKSAVLAADQPYWKGPYITVPERIHTDGVNIADTNMVDVAYWNFWFTAAAGGVGDCPNLTKIGSGNALQVRVLGAVNVPRAVADHLKSSLGTKICVASTTDATTAVYALVEEVY